ncbi:dihydrodipicolinate synthase family protein [Microvirga pudoricolor]|uniref:dihydrodipicolinate synthase family protein n=1 Tax=Microvirga pudoricolor TaxID=2778729 RepID=UPI00194DDE9B|nr:dihydrodipicolinate synthase family protein [Microvirga pudoricolor]MBM6593649.1 dihydrodipicolinate synthase family protein [Microvirga pudoricolor]
MLKGILPVLPTPFAATGVPDEAAMARIVDFAVASGADGVVFPGFASEVDELSAAERGALLSLVVKRVAGRVPVVAGASAPSAEAVIGHAREALGHGVSTLMIQAPKSVGIDAAAVAAFYKTIADAVPEIRIVLQNAPAPRGSDLKPDVIVEIVSGNPAIAYVKEETLPAGPAITSILANRASHLTGVIGGGGARYILDEYARGACGAMPAVEIADIHVALDRAYRSGDVDRARDLYRRTLPLLVIQANFRMAFTKYVLTRRGILDNHRTRAKGPALDRHDLREIDAWLDSVSDLLTVAPLQRLAGAAA